MGLRRSRNAIGLEIGDSYLKLVEMSGGAGRPRILAWGRCALPSRQPVDGTEWIDALAQVGQQLIKEAGATSRNVVVGLPDTVVHYTNVRLPSMPHTELVRAAEWEGKQRFADLKAPLAIRHLRAGSVAGTSEKAKEEIIVIGVSQDVIDDCVNALDRIGLRPRAIEVQHVALARFAATAPSRFAADEQTRMILNVEKMRSRLLIVSEGRIAFCHTLNIGDCEVDESEIAVDTAKLADEIALKQFMPGLRHYAVAFRGGRPDKLLLCGEESLREGMNEALSRRLGVAVHPTDPRNVWGAPSGADTEAKKDDWTIAVGLALRGQYSVRLLRERAA